MTFGAARPVAQRARRALLPWLLRAAVSAIVLTFLFTIVPIEQVWNDACDTGLTLISQRTGREMVYAVEHIEKDRDGDLLFWDLLPANLSDRDGALKIRVFND